MSVLHFSAVSTQNPHTHIISLIKSASFFLNSLRQENLLRPTDTMFPHHQPPNPNPQTFFFPSQFHHHQNYYVQLVQQPSFVNYHPHPDIYVYDPSYFALPNHHYHPPSHDFLQSQQTPAPKPRRLPKPRRNTNIRPRRKVVASKKHEQVSTSEGSSSVIVFPEDSHQQVASNTTTLMIKNVPNHFDAKNTHFDHLWRNDLLCILRDHCLEENLKAVVRSEPTEKSEFDFLYLPMDFKQFWQNRRISNLGYAFVNFTSPVAALRFYKQYHKYEWPVQKNKKICEITCAKTQGKRALVKGFRNKVFWCHSDEYLPVIIEPPCDGTSISNFVTVGTLAGRPKTRRVGRSKRA